MESLKELNQICQKPKYREVGNWMVRHILRDAALPITWLLLHTQVTANQVTLASFAIALLGVIFLAIPSNGFFMFGVIFLQLWYLFDHVDGQIARYRKTASLTGRFFDFMMHQIVHPCIFFGLAFYVYGITERSIFLIWGFVTCLSMIVFNAIHDTKYKTFFERLAVLGSSFKIVPPKNATITEQVAVNFQPAFKKIFSILHKISEVHVLMNVLTAAALIQLLLPVDFRFFLFLVYGTIVPAIAITKITYLIVNQKIDEEFSSQVQILNS